MDEEFFFMRAIESLIILLLILKIVVSFISLERD